MKKKLEKYYPLGYDYKPEIIITALMCIFVSAWVFLSYRTGLLYELKPITQDHINGVRVIVETADFKVPSFISGLDVLETFLLVIIFAVLTAVYRYFYHYQHSKSIYLMKRLPKRNELCKRCVSGSVIISVIGLAFMVGLTAVCLMEYLMIVPEEFVRIF